MGRENGSESREQLPKRGKRKAKIEKAPDISRIRDDWVAAVRGSLIAWAETTGRDLPWKASRNPYHVLVSEMMLVQTTVAVVIPYFARFIARFPDPQSLVHADEAELLKVWEGLGYYRRARQLQAAARMLVEEHQGVVPRDVEAVRALPGVGRYMAGAILSFAYDLAEPIVEANSQRVLARLLAWRQDLKTRASQEWLWEVAARLVPEQGAGVWNQALMDLGALICTPRNPSCLLCPLKDRCGARAEGVEGLVPVIAPRPAPLAVEEVCGLVVRDGEILVVQRQEGGLWSRFWEFPTVHVTGADPAGRSFGNPVELAEGITRLTGIRARVGAEVHALTYAVTRHRVRLRAHVAQALSGTLKPGPGLADVRFTRPEHLGDLPLGSASRRLATWIAREKGALGLA